MPSFLWLALCAELRRRGSWSGAAFSGFFQYIKELLLNFSYGLLPFVEHKLIFAHKLIFNSSLAISRKKPISQHSEYLISPTSCSILPQTFNVLVLHISNFLLWNLSVRSFFASQLWQSNAILYNLNNIFKIS